MVKNIVYICDDNYVVPTIVSIKSITENCSSSYNSDYVIYICTWGISDESRERFSALETENTKIRIISVDTQKYQEQLKRVQQYTYVTPTALLKFELPQILPEINEVLYLDSDVIINQSLDSIFAYDVTNYALAASFDIVYYLAVVASDAHETRKPDFYFNAGVMLLNLKMFRDRGISQLLWESKLSSKYQASEKLKLMDQKPLNAVLANDCLPLPVQFNCPVQFSSYTYADISRINFLYGTNYSKLIELLQDAVVIHYIGRRSKPWLYEPCIGQSVWDNYCRKAGIPPEDLQRRSPNEKPSDKKTIRYYASRLRGSIAKRGMRKTVKYVLYRRELQRWSKDV